MKLLIAFIDANEDAMWICGSTRWQSNVAVHYFERDKNVEN